MSIGKSALIALIVLVGLLGVGRGLTVNASISETKLSPGDAIVVGASFDDTDPGSSSPSASQVNPAEADLIVVKSDSPDPVDVGEQLTYTVVVTNNGPATSRRTMLEDNLPTSVNFVSATPTQGN